MRTYQFLFVLTAVLIISFTIIISCGDDDDDDDNDDSTSDDDDDDDDDDNDDDDDDDDDDNDDDDDDDDTVQEDCENFCTDENAQIAIDCGLTSATSIIQAKSECVALCVSGELTEDMQACFESFTDCDTFMACIEG